MIFAGDLPGIPEGMSDIE